MLDKTKWSDKMNIIERLPKIEENVLFGNEIEEAYVSKKNTEKIIYDLQRQLNHILMIIYAHQYSQVYL